MNGLAWISIVLGCAAAIDDLRRRAISNWISVTGVAAGLTYHAWRHGLQGLAVAAAGAAIGFVIFLLVYLMKGMGGGDLKLMAAFGALLGPRGILIAALLIAIIGGIAAAATLIFDRRKRAIPYAPAIVLGSWLVLLSEAAKP